MKKESFKNFLKQDNALKSLYKNTFPLQGNFLHISSAESDRKAYFYSPELKGLYF